MMSAILLRAAALVVIGSAIGMASNQLRFGAPFAQVASAEICEALAEVQAPGLLHAQDAAGWCAHSNAVIVDVRDARDYERGHIVGAVHLPCSGDPMTDQMFSRLDHSLGVLVYGRDEAEPMQVAQSLVRRGYGGRVFVLAGGYDAWETSGLACQSGPCPDCDGEPR